MKWGQAISNKGNVVSRGAAAQEMQKMTKRCSENSPLCNVLGLVTHDLARSPPASPSREPFPVYMHVLCSKHPMAVSCVCGPKSNKNASVFFPGMSLSSFVTRLSARVSSWSIVLRRWQPILNVVPAMPMSSRIN